MRKAAGNALAEAAVAAEHASAMSRDLFAAGLKDFLTVLVGEAKEGQKVTFTVDAFPGHLFPGRITQLRYQSTTTNNVVPYLAVISVDNSQMLLRPGRHP